MIAALFVNWPLHDQDPRAPTYGNLGLVVARRGRVAEATEMFRRAIEANARHTPALHNLARAELKVGRIHPQATEALRLLGAP